MIVVGVDPGARQTGIAVVSTMYGLGPHPGPKLLASTTVTRDGREPMLEVSRAHLHDVTAAILDAARKWEPDLVAVEGLKRPSWRVAGKVKPTDPSPIIAAGIVLGSILGRAWTPAELVVVPVGGNGASPLQMYPTELRPTRGLGAGHDRLRHERSAYDVALRAPTCVSLARRKGTMYA